ncbi:MAG: type II toxin-antitoxin system HicB family antitoxin [Clostridia bacterium]|nr:type II toxin-antitoxin system HicB family antitoxin [Clostridia bacterium]
MVFIYNEDENIYNGYIPDLTLYCEGETLESVYACAEELIKYYVELATKYDTEVATPSTLEDISKKWVGYKVSLITANVADK